ncbi:MAG TPA: GTP-binding protein [Abditibacterium sp.]|jgi:G3E family GTPase
MTKPLLPIALVTGFLGSGKTTFMRHLLRDAANRGIKVGVVINEFGVADIDGSILRESGADMLGSLAGGCACCSSQDEMIWTMIELGRLPRESQPDVVLLESSGLADPLVMLDGLTVAALLPLVRVASVVCVVDAPRLPELKTNSGQIAPLLARGVALADLIIGNKSDLAFRGEKAAEKADAEAVLREINPRARLEWARGGEIELETFWARILNEDSAHDAPISTEAVHGHAQTLVVPMTKPILREKLEWALKNLDANVWRAKGFVRISGENDLFLVQVAGIAGTVPEITRFEIDSQRTPPPCELVFIGPALDKTTLWRDFAGTLPLL